MNFSIQHQLTQKEYRQLSFTLTYQKWFIILVNALALVYLVLLIITKGSIWNNDTSSFGVAVVVLSVWYPIAILIGVNRNYKSNYRLNEEITYSFSDEGYSVTGESFNSQLNWEKVYKVKIIKGWILLYSNSRIASLIKVGAEDENNVEILKAFLKNGNFKAKLKW
ncbi:YcxB family protein [Mucilaginibacter sp. BT774]|uniref:YcxB family protein n=1 Tax=Mucilaginibacter sp. BT774 TaxID=3062276 RepID=UPI0026761FD4|nr:YcxB family protein [Mucilaginibacter sp. BT774]MDO3627227.1 YcxB family protein [Mucilaginibacter sp. BT774]